MKKIGIVGGTGYTGAELLRLLLAHPEAEVATITSRAEQGREVAELYPNLRGITSLRFDSPEEAPLGDCDLVFFATPNGVAMQQVPSLLAKGVRVIDLAADFRLQDAEQWAEWYGQPHQCPELLAAAVYGLPEINRQSIKGAQLVANPGCYPTAVQLALLPLVKHKLVDLQALIADTKSGVSGAGRGANVGTLLCESSENFKAYGATGHRHLPEIVQGLAHAGEVDRQQIALTFVPHLTPMIRGIHATCYSKLTVTGTNLQELFVQHYLNEPFVDVMPVGSHPETRSVKGSNLCRIAVHQPFQKDTVVVLSVIDNLVKGAAGQAVQNMNIMLGFPEQLGLQVTAVLP
ncbi:N-acetyl-gamma-glutamyl-phosphate reductase [Zooshikella sp. RANM57]|uniref:N-acetyl-gamma-glutamyl-phosphate reductase n=1 Tax=Zooshikella sp. RANM57 TaxID=3425863 RepID=UPI003D6E508F